MSTTLHLTDLSAVWPPWVVMWVMSVAIYLGFKLLIWLEAAPGLSGTRWQAFLFAWPGMDPRPFATVEREAQVAELAVWLWASAKTTLGCALIWLAPRWAIGTSPLLAGWLGMFGLVFLLHFGLFHLLALIWRARGVPVVPIMDAPWRSTSLAEFWGRRWNRAFRDLSERLVMRPLTPRIGAARAMFVVFLMSGLIHDAVISIPAGGGYGGPTVYFLLQAVGLSAQRTSIGRRLSCDRGMLGRTVTAAILIGPLGILFHPPFVLRVIVPFLGAIGALGDLP